MASSDAEPNDRTSTPEAFPLRPIGRVRSALVAPGDAPRQGSEGAPDAWLEIEPAYERGLSRLEAGQRVIVITWLHLADRGVLEVHPRDDASNPLTGVFATRSQDRPNPLGLHPVTVRERRGRRLLVGPIEAVDGTPIVDLKPVIDE